MELLGGRVSSVWLMHDVRVAKQIQLGPQLLPGATGETLNIDGNTDGALVHPARGERIPAVITR